MSKDHVGDEPLNPALARPHLPPRPTVYADLCSNDPATQIGDMPLFLLLRPGCSGIIGHWTGLGQPVRARSFTAARIFYSLSGRSTSLAHVYIDTTVSTNLLLEQGTLYCKGGNGEYQAHVSSLTLTAPPIPYESSSKQIPSCHSTRLPGSLVPWKLNCNPGSSHSRVSLVVWGGGAHSRVNGVSVSHLGDIRAPHLVQSLSRGGCSSIAMLCLHCPSSGVGVFA